MDKFPDWSPFQERETSPMADDLLSPAAEIATTLRSTYAELARKQQALWDIEQSSFAELAQQAVLVIQLGQLLEESVGVFINSPEQKQVNPLSRVYKSLQINQKQMLDALRKAGLEIEIPIHKTYAEVAESIEIEQWRHHQDFTEEIVVEVLEPIVRKGALLRSGRVIMGAPLSAQPLETMAYPDIRKDETGE